MSGSIDIRKHEKVKEIVFGDPIHNCPSYNVATRLTHEKKCGASPDNPVVYVRPQFDGDAYVIVDENHARNMIKAIEESIRRGWFNK